MAADETDQGEEVVLAWSYQGQRLKLGKAATLGSSPSHRTKDAIATFLCERGEDLDRFEPWAYSEKHESYVALQDFEGPVPGVIEKRSGIRKLSIRLEERKSARMHGTLGDPPGFFGIGIVRGKRDVNHGTLWRSAGQLGAAFTYTVGRRYGRLDVQGDTGNVAGSIPCFNCDGWHDFAPLIPVGTALVGIEMGGTPLPAFEHPERCIYVLGAEDSGLTAAMHQVCDHIVSIPSLGFASYNVAVAGTLVMYDRWMKLAEWTPSDTVEVPMYQSRRPTSWPEIMQPKQRHPPRQLKGHLPRRLRWRRWLSAVGLAAVPAMAQMKSLGRIDSRSALARGHSTALPPAAFHHQQGRLAAMSWALPARACSIT
mmetsp:Transcript_39525/g.92981  ORF Transcript_39525/g.92981 Transcript_39525/m.92981 type:complete len:369 (+) Transcript_39525:40-1146(+)